MIITRTPFRLTLGGGGTDLPSYYSKHGGFIFAASINKYIYISVNKPFDQLVRIKYSESETVEHRDQVRHNIAREALRKVNIDNSIEIASIADIPSGTGLGSSSSYAVGLLNALHTYKREFVNPYELAEEACSIEIDTLKCPIGKQDQFMAAYGGLAVLEINYQGKVAVRQARISDSTLDDLNRNILMFYTFQRRSANDILYEQTNDTKKNKKDVVESMHYIKEIGYKILDAVESGNITDVGLMFNKHWQYKKRISTKMSNPQFDQIYSTALAKGAIGGKIIGAGGGGFFLFYVEEHHGDFIQNMKKLGLSHMRYRFDSEGSKLLINMRDGTF